CGTAGAKPPPCRARLPSRSANGEVRLNVRALLDQRRDAAVLARDRDAGAVRERAAADLVRHVEDPGRDGVLSAGAADAAVAGATHAAGAALARAAGRTDRTVAGGGATVDCR